MKIQVTLIAAALALGACNKKDDEKGAGETPPKDETTAKPEAAPSGPFGAFDGKAVIAKLQGDWVIPSGIRQIGWHVEGTKVNVLDGAKEETLELVAESPCTIRSVKKEAGGSSSTTHRFVWEGSDLLMGGDLGVRGGGMTVACISADIFTLEGDACKKWTMRFEKWNSEEAECAILKEGDVEHFVAQGRSGEVKLAFAGDVLKTSGANKAEKKASWDEVKAALAAK